ncbi:hypothetical protein [Filimonas effusa]|uniref:Uncharacterized protein n=1 Tax=Filimonas effusa TaxID=2508721 RepID=A0A4Q1DD39_9BACT|nr:hypothetical protein [Filimonas effusa]RXK86898.1 hypothetical protein ESB13_08940 [Filimonas effusa]
MKQIYFLISLLVLGSALPAQTPDNAYLALQPYEVKGHINPFKFNITFGPYKATRIRRSLGSIFNFGDISLRNILVDMAGLPPYLQEQRQRAKDVFSFNLTKEEETAGTTKCRAILHQNERVRLLVPSDSAFFSVNNVDFLQAVIMLNNDTAQVWQMLASNLNGSMNEPQKGLLRHDTVTIKFEKTTMLLREKALDRTDVNSLLATLNMVYSFTCNNQVIAALSFKDSEKRFWLHEKADPKLAQVIAHAAMVLTLRRQLYQ